MLRLTRRSESEIAQISRSRKRAVLRPDVVELVVRQREHAVEVVEPPERLGKRHLIWNDPFCGGSLARGIRVFTKIQIILRDGIVRIDAQQLLIMRLRALRIPLHKARVCELVQYVFRHKAWRASSA